MSLPTKPGRLIPGSLNLAYARRFIAGSFVSQPDFRAFVLLYSTLSQDQRTHFIQHGFFWVGSKYIVTAKPSYNVIKPLKEIDSKTFLGLKFCTTASTGLSDIPIYDVMLTQRMLLECRPKEFFKIANTSGSEPYVLNEIGRCGRTDMRSCWRLMQKFYPEFLGPEVEEIENFLKRERGTDEIFIS